MSNSLKCVLYALVLSAAGCSAESLQRTGYETLQNIEEQRCQKDLSAECPQRDSFDAYQRDRQGLQQAD
jgi:hypothetical protein